MLSPRSCLALSLLYLICPRNVSTIDFPTVRVSTHLGEIEGSFMLSEGGTQFPAFRGIPYAKPPLGQRRFRKPEPVEKWDGVLDATKNGPVCTQMDGFSRWYIGEEDCLSLNIYTPQLPTSEIPVSKPVMVWIHGGGYFWGSGHSEFYGPNKIIEHDVILVTINYRLGALGFLSTLDDAARGNYGLWDQIEALRWVQANIRYFGGDPERVTIFGESAGGFSTGALVMTPKAKGLFARAISQSGSAICLSLGKPAKVIKGTEFLANKVGCTTESSHKMIDCLRQVPAVDLVKQYYPVKMTAENLPPVALYPVLDGELFTSKPLKALREGHFNRVPFMAGINNDEGEFMYNALFSKVKANRDILKAAMKPWLPTLPIAQDPEDIEQIIQTYFTEGMNEDAVKSQMEELLSDIFMTTCTYRTIKEISAHDVPTYAYRFDHKGDHSVTGIIYQTETRGVPHFDELIYQFDMPVYGVPRLSGKDKEIEQRMLKLWTNFAKFGSPTTDNSWVRFQSKREHYRFSTNAMDNRPFSPQQEFFDSLVDKAAKGE